MFNISPFPLIFNNAHIYFSLYLPPLSLSVFLSAFFILSILRLIFPLLFFLSILLLFSAILLPSVPRCILLSPNAISNSLPFFCFLSYFPFSLNPCLRHRLFAIVSSSIFTSFIVATKSFSVFLPSSFTPSLLPCLLLFFFLSIRSLTFPFFLSPLFLPYSLNSFLLVLHSSFFHRFF